MLPNKQKCKVCSPTIFLSEDATPSLGSAGVWRGNIKPIDIDHIFPTKTQ